MSRNKNCLKSCSVFNDFLGQSLIFIYCKGIRLMQILGEKGLPEFIVTYSVWQEAVYPAVAPEYGKYDHSLALHSIPDILHNREMEQEHGLYLPYSPQTAVSNNQGLGGATLGPVYVVSVDRAGPCLSVNNEFRNMFNL